MADFTCILAALFVFTGNLLLAIWVAMERQRSPEDWNAFHELDPDFLAKHWQDRRDLTGLHLAGSFIVALSWVLITIPILQAAYVLSNGGKRKLWFHTMMCVLAISAATTEFVARLMHVGAWNTGNWISKDFYLADWGGDPSKPNGIGWKALEITYQLTQGQILWVDGWEYFALFGILLMNFLSIRTSTIGLLGNEMCWAGTGLFIGLLSLADFIFIFIRFKSWSTYNLVSLLMTIMIRMILLPSWLLMLSFKLPPAVEEFNERRRNQPRGVTAPSISISNGAPPAPTAANFTIED